ncbi:lectin-like protein [Chitinophagaceae bacterium 26-R-25]|nr:lectin-like protein [Chitinophagaceae bacterium 26-R-25]
MIPKLLKPSVSKALLYFTLCICCLMQIQFAQAQNKDSKGKDFWLMFNSNLGTPTLTLFITSNVNTSGKVEIPGLSFSQAFTVQANKVTSVVVPAASATHTNNVVDNKGIHITSVDEVTVYGLNYIPFTADAYLGLPVDALGTDYIVVTYKNSLVNGVEIGVVSTADNNQVTITPTVTTLTRTAGVPFTITLNKGQTYELMNNTTASGDFTGTTITSTQPIGVFGAHMCGNVPGGAAFCDHLVEMLPPTSTWGKKFGLVPLKSRINGDTWRFLASENGTVVSINGVAQPAVNKGQFVEKVLQGQNVIESNNPILVCQYANGSTFSGNPGDPFMMLIPPLEQFLANYTVTTVSGYVTHFINVVAPKAIVGTLTMDGVIIPAGSFTPIGTTGFSGAQLTVQPGSHTLNGTLPFGVFMYGFNNDDAYGYPGGQSFSEVATVTSVVISPKTGTGSIANQTCFNATVKDQFGHAVSDIRVDFNIKGMNPGSSGFALTDANGVANFCYKGPLAGKDTITATVGSLTDAAIFTWTESNVCNLTATATSTNANGDALDGSAKIMVNGGTAPFTFTLNAMTNSDGIFNGIGAGTYSFSIKDAKNCTASGTVIVSKNVVTPPTTTVKCPKDTVIDADPITCKATVAWPEPNFIFPDSIALPPAYNEPNSNLWFKGTYNNHAYYVSDGFYKWPVAKDLAAARGGHLVTITSQGESDFIFTNFKQGIVYGPWIGLYNTGDLGKFAWVTGEPLVFTHWSPSEPNNHGGRLDSIAEPYVHIWGPDPKNGWNDLTGLFYLPFIAEFDEPIIIYKQISGPPNFSQQTPGVYTVCYEATNRITNKKDTCCFTVEVKCRGLLTTCPSDTTIKADPGTCKVKLKLPVPSINWPATIPIPDGMFTKNNMLTFGGAYNGHGYYSTNGAYRWPEADQISKDLKGHLVTIGSSGENSFINDKFRKINAYAPWIGLYNTGTVGSFAWVTGEPLTYTNWFPTEPNNKGGNANVIAEPYVLLNGYDFLNRWNDMGRFSLAGFVTEFERPMLGFKQKSGPIEGTEVGPGVYEICYEVTDSSMNVTFDCCFKITVVCDSNMNPLSNTALNVGRVNSEQPKLFKASAVPNPSVTNFKVKINSDNMVERVSVQVVDISGRVLEAKNNVVPNSTVTVGDGFSRGVYFIQVIQGTKREILRVVKE